MFVLHLNFILQKREKKKQTKDKTVLSMLFESVPRKGEKPLTGQNLHLRVC